MTGAGILLNFFLVVCICALNQSKAILLSLLSNKNKRPLLQWRNQQIGSEVSDPSAADADVMAYDTSPPSGDIETVIRHCNGNLNRS